MPLPQEYRRASEQFLLLLSELRDQANFGSTHQAYTMLQGVLQVFRRRLSIADAIHFANALPAMLRALFVADWDTGQSIEPFSSLEAMNAEVKLLRKDHNFSTDTAIEDVRLVLQRFVDSKRLAKALAGQAPMAKQFWGLD